MSLTGSIMTDKCNETAIELYEIYKERIAQIKDELKGDDALTAYFAEAAGFVTAVINAADKIKSGAFKSMTLKERAALQDELYAHITKGYNDSYLDPDTAVARLGSEQGRILSAIYAELTSMIVYAYECDTEALDLRLSLFLEVYGAYAASLTDGEELTAERIVRIYRDYAYDCTQDMTDHAASELFRTDDNGVAGRIIGSADLSDPSYLYEYGEYITDNEIRMSSYLSSLPDERIAKMAGVYIDGYVKGFAATGKDITIKDRAEVRYFIGFERVVREAVRLLKDNGLDVTFNRSEPSFTAGRKLIKNGYFSTLANKQFEADHENDRVVYFDRAYMEHRLMCYRNSLESLKAETDGYAGPAVIECFGEKPVILKNKDGAYKPDDAYNALNAEYKTRAVDILNEYVNGEERSFTIISFPIPAIGEDFEKIFDETVKLNTLDYELYQGIQQRIIDVLDTADHMRIEGTGGNKTDLTVNLYKLKDPAHETIFENCVADVNIPVGEVFTSPVLEGTNGTLHVKSVYLNEMPFKDLTVVFKDGMIEDYSCANYESAEENREYITKYLLFSHKTLPIGEFAIGTNTSAYVMSKKYGIEDVMPILIAEKTGPHFAVGDTCYSHEEDVTTYNPDGKAIVARENSVSALRKSDPLKAYFGCHTDITIPYDELGRLYAVTADGTETDIIRDGRFVLKGTEVLNEPLEQETDK